VQGFWGNGCRCGAEIQPIRFSGWIVRLLIWEELEEPSQGADTATNDFMVITLQPAKALEVALQEYGRRHDVYTLDAYAWALHVNGQDAAARKRSKPR